MKRKEKLSKGLFYVNMSICILFAIVGFYSGCYASKYVVIKQYFDYVKPLREIYIATIPFIIYGIWSLVYVKKNLNREYYYQGNIIFSWMIIANVAILYIFAILASIFMILFNFLEIFFSI